MPRSDRERPGFRRGPTTRAKRSHALLRANSRVSQPEAETLSRFIGQIYDAALASELWSAVLEECCRFVHAADAVLASHDWSSVSADFSFSWGVDEAHHRSYVEKYVKLNPTASLFQMTRVGETYSAGSLMPYEEMRSSQFFKEWAQPIGYVDFVAATLDRSGTSVAQIIISRHQRHGLSDEGARRRLAFLAPHLRRAILIGNAINLHKVEGAMLADTLDGLAAGLFLVDRHGNIIHANASGHNLIAEAGVLSSVRGALVATDRAADHALSAACAAAADGDAQACTGGNDIPLTSRTGARYMAHVLPLTSGARRAAGGFYHAAAAVFVRKAVLPASSPAEMLVKLYKLTPSELRVLHLVVEIGGVSAVAAALGLSAATVKTHLHHLFSKTGTTCQADLVKLVASHASPVGV